MGFLAGSQGEKQGAGCGRVDKRRPQQAEREAELCILRVARASCPPAITRVGRLHQALQHVERGGFRCDCLAKTSGAWEFLDRWHQPHQELEVGIGRDAGLAGVVGHDLVQEMLLDPRR